MLNEFAKLVPAELFSRSGNVFYSGHAAFAQASPLYILGYNPGGDVVAQADETIGANIARSLKRKEAHYSEYKDASWAGQPAGTFRMQPRVTHLLEKLELDPHKVPASNLIFVRSRNEVDIRNERKRLEDLCWPFHQRVIEALDIRVVVCFGGTVGSALCHRLNAHGFVGAFQETNARRWKTTAHRNEHGIIVITATHPSRADWTKPASDPSGFIKSMLAIK